MKIKQDSYNSFLTVYIVTCEDYAVRIIHAPNGEASIEKYVKSGRTDLDEFEEYFFGCLTYALTGNRNPSIAGSSESKDLYDYVSTNR